MFDRTPTLPIWPAIALKARAPHSVGLELEGDIPLTPNLHTHICFQATGEVSHFLPIFFNQK